MRAWVEEEVVNEKWFDLRHVRKLMRPDGTYPEWFHGILGQLYVYQSQSRLSIYVTVTQGVSSSE